MLEGEKTDNIDGDLTPNKQEATTVIQKLTSHTEVSLETINTDKERDITTKGISAKDETEEPIQDILITDTVADILTTETVEDILTTVQVDNEGPGLQSTEKAGYDEITVPTAQKVRN